MKSNDESLSLSHPHTQSLWSVQRIHIGLVLTAITLYLFKESEAGQLIKACGESIIDLAAMLPLCWTSQRLQDVRGGWKIGRGHQEDRGRRGEGLGPRKMSSGWHWRERWRGPGTPSTTSWYCSRWTRSPWRCHSGRRPRRWRSARSSMPSRRLVPFRDVAPESAAPRCVCVCARVRARVSASLFFRRRCLRDCETSGYARASVPRRFFLFQCAGDHVPQGLVEKKQLKARITILRNIIRAR